MKTVFGTTSDQSAPAAETIPDPAVVAADVSPATPADGAGSFEQAMPPVKYAASKGGLVLGDKIPEFADIILPRLNIVQGVGQLKDSFPQGAVVFNQSVVLFIPPVINKGTGNVEKPGTPPVNVTVIGFRPTRYAEKIVGGGRGLICDSEEQVRANGGTLDYREWTLKKASGMKRFEVLADALVAIERPAICTDDDTVFVYPVGDKKYALALWGLKGSAYTEAAKRVFFTARATGCLRTGYPTYNYNLSTRLKSFDGGNSAWIPVCLPAQKNSPEFINWVASVLAAPDASATEAN